MEPNRRPATARGDAAIDWAIALENAYRNPDVLRDITVIFLDELPSKLQQLDEALRTKDAAAVQRVAHTIKGDCRIFGAQRAAEHALQIELLARQGAMADNDLVASLRQETERVAGEMVAFLSTGPAPGESPAG